MNALRKMIHNKFREKILECIWEISIKKRMMQLYFRLLFAYACGNLNDYRKEIMYQWEKWNDDAGQYEAVQNANGKKYTIGKLAKKDYGNYRVKAG